MARTEPAAPVEPTPERPAMSEGVWQELLVRGEAGDPLTGKVFVLDRETNSVTYK